MVACHCAQPPVDHHNARLRSLDRGDRYQDPLQAALDARAPGSKVTGAGTQLTADREPAFSDIDLYIEGDAEAALGLAVATLEAAGAPKGSRARLDEREPVTFGVTERLAVYLNGTDLPDEVYATSDVNALVAALLSSLGGEGHMQSYWQGPRAYWQGPRETALYLYGPSAARMNDLIAKVLARFPLAQGCRVVPLQRALEAGPFCMVQPNDRVPTLGRSPAGHPGSRCRVRRAAIASGCRWALTTLAAMAFA